MKSVRAFARGFASQMKKIHEDPATWIVVNAVFLASHAAALGKSLDDWWWRVPMALAHLAYIVWASRFLTCAKKPKSTGKRTAQREPEPQHEEYYCLGRDLDDNGDAIGPKQVYHVVSGTVRLLTRDEIDELIASADPEDTETIDRLLDARARAPLASKAKELQRQPEKPRETGRETSERGGK